MAGGTTSETAVGGMASKIQAAKIVTRSGIPLDHCLGSQEKCAGEHFEWSRRKERFSFRTEQLSGRKRWIAFFHSPHGTVYVDEGCKTALCAKKAKVLLPPGVKRCEGNFAAGEVVRVCDLNGTEFARGICYFNSDSLKTRDLPRTEVIHRDNLVIL